MGSCTAMKQKSSIRGSPTCSTMKFSSVNSVAAAVDVGDVEGVLVERPDRRALVDVDVAHAQLLAPLEVAIGLGVGQLPAPRAVTPLGGVELHALAAPPGHVVGQLLQAGVALAGVPAGVEQELAGVLLGELGVPLGGVEAVLVPLQQVGRLEDGDVDVPVFEEVLHQVVVGVRLEVLHRPVGVGRRHRLVAVEALDPALGVLLRPGHPVLLPGVPVVDVAVNDEVALAVLRVHGPPPCHGPGHSARAHGT